MSGFPLRLKRFCALGKLSLLVGAVLCLASSGCARTEKTEGLEPVSAQEISETPRPAKFILGPGDEVAIMVWRNDDLSLTQRISPTGDLHYPLVGDIKASGLSITELREAIAAGLSEYLVDPQVTVSVSSYVNQKVFVLGEVNRPGVFPIVGSMNMVEAISGAQGFTLDAASNSVVLIRGGAGEPQLALLDMKQALEKGVVSDNVALRGGDIVYVPASTVANVDRFFQRLRDIVLPIVTLETGIILGPLVEDALQGKSTRAVVTTGR